MTENKALIDSYSEVQGDKYKNTYKNFSKSLESASGAKNRQAQSLAISAYKIIPDQTQIDIYGSNQDRVILQNNEHISIPQSALKARKARRASVATSYKQTKRLSVMPVQKQLSLNPEAILSSQPQSQRPGFLSFRESDLSRKMKKVNITYRVVENLGGLNNIVYNFKTEYGRKLEKINL